MQYNLVIHQDENVSLATAETLEQFLSHKIMTSFKICLADLTHLLCSHLLCCFCGPKTCVTTLSYIISVSCVSWFDIISNIKP